MKPEYIGLLTVEERSAAMRLGAHMKLAEHGALYKQAISPVQLSASGTAKAVALTALIAGIPIGAAGHAIGRKVSKDSRKQKELKERIRYYREATRGIHSGLAGI